MASACLSRLWVCPFSKGQPRTAGSVFGNSIRNTTLIQYYHTTVLSAHDMEPLWSHSEACADTQLSHSLRLSLIDLVIERQHSTFQAVPVAALKHLLEKTTPSQR